MRSKSEKTVLWLLLLSSAVALAYLVSIPLNQKVRAQTQSIRPYTIQYHGVATSDQGEATPYDFLVAARSNGDSMSQDSRPNSPRILKLLAAGLLIAIAPSAKNVMTMGDGKPSLPQRFGDNCEGYSGHTGETKTILGFRTVKVLSNGLQQTPDGKEKTMDIQESWLAPDLNCRYLEQKTTWTFNGQANGFTVETADWALAAEPDPTLFEIPKEAVEVPPSIFYPALGRSFEPHMETMYYKRRQQRAALSMASGSAHQ